MLKNNFKQIREERGLTNILFLSSKSIAGSKFAFVSKIIIACLTFASAVLYIAGLSNLIVSFTGGAPIEVICLLVIPAVSSLATIILTIIDIVKSKKNVVEK